MANTNNNNIVRVTKAQKYNAIIALLEGKEPVVISSADEKADVTLDAEYLCGFCRDELNLLRKKSANKKPTVTQEANEGLRALILAFLNTQDSPKTCSEIMRNIPELSDFSNQKVAALLKRLTDDHQVEKTTVKGKSLFAVV